MSTVKQISIFLENKSGRLYEIMEILGKEESVNRIKVGIKMLEEDVNAAE